MATLFTLRQVEARRLVWITGLLFALIVALEYFELPCIYKFVSTYGRTGNGPARLSNPSNNTGLERPTNNLAVKNLSMFNTEDVTNLEEPEQTLTHILIRNETTSVTRNFVSEDVTVPASTPATAGHSETLRIEKTKEKSEELTEKSRTRLIPVQDVFTLSDMNNLLTRSRESNYSEIPKWSSAVDRELHDAALQIENAPIVKSDLYLYAPIYRNISMFKRSYELMENTLKVYIYKEGEIPFLLYIEKYNTYSCFT